MEEKDENRVYATFEFDHNTGILFKYYFGQITLKDIIATWDDAISNKLIPGDTRGFILDYRNATFNFNVPEYPGIPKYYREHLDIFGNKRIAVLTENPSDVIIPILVKKEDEGYKSKPFYTLEAAMAWVLNGS